MPYWCSCSLLASSFKRQTALRQQTHALRAWDPLWAASGVGLGWGSRGRSPMSKVHCHEGGVWRTGDPRTGLVVGEAQNGLLTACMVTVGDTRARCPGKSKAAPGSAAPHPRPRERRPQSPSKLIWHTLSRVFPSSLPRYTIQPYPTPHPNTNTNTAPNCLPRIAAPHNPQKDVMSIVDNSPPSTPSPQGDENS